MARTWQDRCVAYIKTATTEYYGFDRIDLPTVRELARRFGVRQEEVFGAMIWQKGVKPYVGGRVNGRLNVSPRATWTFEWIGNDASPGG